jgi:hypothetical protein
MKCSCDVLSFRKEVVEGLYRAFDDLEIAAVFFPINEHMAEAVFFNHFWPPTVFRAFLNSEQGLVSQPSHGSAFVKALIAAPDPHLITSKGFSVPRTLGKACVGPAKDRYLHESSSLRSGRKEFHPVIF